MTITADSTRYTADSHYPTADGFVPADVISVAVIEAADAADALDAKVKAASGGGFGVVWRPASVRGVDDGVLPPLRGEAHGTVGSAMVVTLSIRGEAHGVVDEFPNDLELMLMLLAA